MFIRVNHKVISNDETCFVPGLTVVNTEKVVHTESINDSDVISEKNNLSGYCMEIYYAGEKEPQVLWFETSEQAMKTASMIERVGNGKQIIDVDKIEIAEVQDLLIKVLNKLIDYYSNVESNKIPESKKETTAVLMNQLLDVM